MSVPFGINVDALIPCRNKSQTYVFFRIAASQLRIIHISTDLDANSAHGLRENGQFSSRSTAAFPGGNQMMLAVDGFDFARRGVEPAFIVGMTICSVEHAQQHLCVRIMGGLLK